MKEEREIVVDYDCKVASSNCTMALAWQRLAVWFLQTFCLFPPSLLPGRVRARGRQAGGGGGGGGEGRRYV